MFRKLLVAAMVITSVASANAQGVIPYLASYHQAPCVVHKTCVDTAGAPIVPAHAYAKATKHNRRQAARAVYGQAPEAVPVKFAPRFAPIHEWEDDDYRGWIQFGGGS